MPTSPKRSASSASATRPAARKGCTREKIERYEDGTRKEYDFAGVRGKYADRFRGLVHAVLLADDVAKVFPTSEDVNRALRRLIKSGQRRRKAG